LPGPGEMRYIPDLSDEEVRTYKTDFGKWILTNGLRELVEAYEVSLDRTTKSISRDFPSGAYVSVQVKMNEPSPEEFVPWPVTFLPLSFPTAI
jgi:hypothetical protein